MRVLVTGASGMLGRGVADALDRRGETVTVLQRRSLPGAPFREVRGDLGDPDVVGRATAGQDAVIHLAAKVNVVGAWADYVRTNIDGTQNLLQAAQEAGVGAFVQISSPSVAHAGRSLVGVGAGPADPRHARGNYARSKAAAELLALAADRPGFAVTAIRPHLVWGPGDTQLIGRIQDRARSGRLPLLGPATALMDTTYVTNAVDAIVAALDRIETAHGRALVVTNGEPRPIGELMADICTAGGVPVPTLRIPPSLAWTAGAAVEGAMWAAARLPGVPEITEPPLTRFLAEQLSTAHWFDQRETRQVLDWRPRVSLAEGFERLAAAAS
ncbi:NAD-dependent epimerase/dehydratase family protein [Naumannella halotolerans]|uniref:NAD-dependent epimerase/dehydratase family protein n=1 Tax=Naumannella halotolerans TaxID=993414 RepID=UPI00370D0CC0